MRNREQMLLAELALVQDRVGRTGPDRLAWAVGFARKRLDSLTTSEGLTLRGELLVFPTFIPGRTPSRRPSPTTLRATEQPHGSVDLPTNEETKEAKEAFHAVLERFITHGEARIGPIRVTYRLVRGDRVTRARPRAGTLADMMYPVDGVPNERRVFLFTFPRQHAIAALPRGLLALVHLLSAHGQLLEVCPNCGGWFVASRTNKVYCSSRCLSRKTTRTLREKARKGTRPRRLRRSAARSTR
jgi:hypothetical protein